MCGPILLAAILIPAIELWVIIEVGSRIGALTAVLLVFATAAVGVAFARDQGVATLRRLADGTLPADVAQLDGPLLVLAALCLLVPGFVTDGVGALLLVPPLRRALARKIIERFGRPGGPGGPDGPGTIIVVRRREPPSGGS